MTIAELAEKIGATNQTPQVDTGRNVSCGYVCDLLSWVMARGKADMAWVTVQTHMNVVAVAALADMSAVIAPEGAAFAPEIIDKAQEEGIALLTTPQSAYEIVARLAAAGLPG